MNSIINPKYLRGDLSAGLVVFLVALPLCLGISLASGAPLFAGIISGVLGGLVVGIVSRSNVNVSGPAASVALVILTGIATLGSYEAVLLSVILAGIIQIVMGFIGLGVIAYFFPSAMIKGILASIGLILILKQVPHALGNAKVFEDLESFFNPDGVNTFTEILQSLANVHPGAIIINLAALVLYIIWDQAHLKKRFAFFAFFPAALAAVVLGTMMNALLFEYLFPQLSLSSEHLVTLPVAGSLGEFLSFFSAPDFSFWSNKSVYTIALSIAFIASLESLLSTEAGDRLDPLKRRTPTNRELVAQGVGNIIAGFIGGLPITAVIVRTSANVSSGGRTRTATMFHGLLMLLCVLIIPNVLNKIPLASLAAVLFVVGYKLTSFSLYRSLYLQGSRQFVPFISTIIGVMFTDLITGVLVGAFVSLFIVLKDSYKIPFFTSDKVEPNTHHYILADQVTFLHKANITTALESIPANYKVIVDGSKNIFLDADVREILTEYQVTAKERNIEYELRNVKPG